MAQSVRILVVEDEPLLQRMLGAALKSRGYRVEVCGDGQEAIKWIEAVTFNLVITDFRMPRMTGIMLIQTLWDQPRRIPVILMSSNTLEELGLKPQDLPGVEFLRKPFGLTDLFAAIERALKPPKAPG